MLQLTIVACYDITSHGENRSRPPQACVSEIYQKYDFIPVRITHYNTTVSIMPWTSVLMSYNTSWLDEKLSNRFLMVLTVQAETKWFDMYGDTCRILAGA